MRRKLKIRTGDIVKVIAGNQKGTQGKVLRVYAEKNRAIVGVGVGVSEVVICINWILVVDVDNRQ